jgi:Raf kinase inhibitor-like YbhB/YbcL family protein
MAFTLMSPAFAPGGTIPSRYTCDGNNVSPVLSWSEVPASAQSFALVCADPDAPAGTWYHWAVYDLPAGTTSLPEAYPPAGRSAGKQARNDFKRQRYDGPCPPRGHGRHHYHFKLYALDTASLALKRDADCRAVEAAAETHALGRAELVGFYGR